MNTDEFIERKIVIACITSTEYLQGLSSIWNPELIESPTARLLCNWAKEYFDQYEKAPDSDIEMIYAGKLKAGLQQEQAEWIEDILESLSNESVTIPVNIPAILEQTKLYFQERSLRLLSEDIQFELDKGHLHNAKELIEQFTPVQTTTCTFLNPFSKDVVDIVQAAFAERGKSLIKFPKAFGAFWNRELVRGGFIALMGSEKKGKSMLLLELAMRALKSGSHVAFFQAGDMTELQQLRRIAIYLTERSDEERYCREQWVPVPDCLLHQLDTCNKNCRQETDAQLFTNEKNITFESLVKVAKEHPEHEPCYNCSDERKGVAWLKRRPGCQPLGWTDAYKALKQFGKKQTASFRISTHAAATLSVKGIKHILSQWNKQDGFLPDVVIVDYADLLVSDTQRQEFRHQQNNIWESLRNLSQEQNVLVATVTQIAARGYNKELLSMDDYTEDKRRFAHVTAMYGMNQTPEEKRIGVMRINELVVREADFDSKRPVTILQRLQIGRPFLGSWL
jgi:hypothetical protein